MASPSFGMKTYRTAARVPKTSPMVNCGATRGNSVVLKIPSGAPYEVPGLTELGTTVPLPPKIVAVVKVAGVNPVGAVAE
jgi:hypothetical protein